MTEFNSFGDFADYYTSSNYEFDNMEISSESYKKIAVYIRNFTKEEISPADMVLSDYYGMEVPEEIIKQCLEKDFELAFEVFSEGIRDTCQRSILVDAVLKYIGMRSWPTYSEGDKVFADFCQELKIKAKTFNILIQE